MPSFHVYVEGPAEPGPNAVRELAQVISERYGLQTAELITRMTKGRFRVKANVDRETADKYQRDLAAIGARVMVEEARLQSSPSTPVPQRTSTPPLNTTRTTTPPPRASVPPPIAEAPVPRTMTTERSAPVPRTMTADRSAPVAARTMTGSAPVAAPEPARSVTADRSAPVAAPVFASGLSAAYSGPQESSDLGALGAIGGGGIALSALDGTGDEEVMENQFSVPAPAARPKQATTPAPKAARPKDVPVEVDMFSPPDGADAEVKMEIAADEIEHRQRKRMSTPPIAVPINGSASGAAPLSTPVLRRPTPSIQPPNATSARREPVPRPRGKLGVLGEPQVRFALGVLVAILLGFIPAHVSASMREHSIYGSIDSKVETVQAAVDTAEEYAALDTFRAEELNQKHSERRMIAFTSLLIWAAAAGALAYVWFRRVPWDKLDAA